VADFVFNCTNCGLRMYGYYVRNFLRCPACGCGSFVARAMEFAELPEEERVKRLQEMKG